MIGQNWRYERMSRGRKREHYQWEMDVFGVPGVEAEAELIAAAITLMRNLGLPDDSYEIRINSRSLFERWIQYDFLSQRPEVSAARERISPVPIPDWCRAKGGVERPASGR